MTSAGCRMSAHHLLPHWPERRDFLRRQIGEPDRFARIDQRVLADQVPDFDLGAMIQRVISGAHIGEFGVGAP